MPGPVPLAQANEGGLISILPSKGIDTSGPNLSFSQFAFRLPSSMVEQLTLNQLVRGSSPRGATTLVAFAPSTFFFHFHSDGDIPYAPRGSIPNQRRCSSTVEHLFCKQAVAGLNPIAGSSFQLKRHSESPLFSLPDGVMVAQTTLTRFV